MKKLAVLLPKYRELTLRTKYFQQILIYHATSDSSLSNISLIRHVEPLTKYNFPH